VSCLFLDGQVETECKGDCAPHAAKPHDELHSLGYFVLSKVVQHERQREYVARSTRQTHDYARNDQSGLEYVLKTKYGHAQIGEHARFGRE
jgi:hypothetical protein